MDCHSKLALVPVTVATFKKLFADGNNEGNDNA
jgi:hypothetical protein